MNAIRPSLMGSAGAARLRYPSVFALRALSTPHAHYLQPLRVTIVHVANIVFSLCATVGALLIAIPSAVKGRWAVAIVFGLLAVGFLLRARAGYRRGEWR
jgi:hypothetical protein